MLRLIGLALIAAAMSACTTTELSGEAHDVERTDGASAPTLQCKQIEVTSGASSSDGAVVASTQNRHIDVIETDLKFGRGERIRTSDPLLSKQTVCHGLQVCTQGLSENP